MHIVFFIILSIIITSCDKYEQDCCGTPTSINLSYPTSFPDPYNPLDNPITEEGVNLGRHLFYDPILSSNNTVSCASCHKQENAFGDNTQYSFSSTEIVKEACIPMHNEMTYSNYRPGFISFYCLEAPSKYGETPIVNCNSVWENLPFKMQYKLQNSPALFYRYFPSTDNPNYKTNKLEYVHTINGSRLATPRLLVSLIETYQTKSGNVKFPSVLDKYIFNQYNVVK